MNNNKQSSVQWVIDELTKLNALFHFGEIGHQSYNRFYKEIIERAKAMHKEEMIDFAMKFMMQDRPIISFYNSTFGGNNE